MAGSHKKTDKENRTRTISKLLSMDARSAEFLTELLVVQCRHAGADAGAILRAGKENQTEVIAAHTVGGNGAAPVWIGNAEKPFRQVLQRVETVIVRESPTHADGKQQWNIVVIPIEHQGSVRAAAAFRIRGENPRKFLVGHARLEMTPLLLGQRELQLTQEMHSSTAHHLRRVLEVLDAVNRPARFLGSAMALCNELAAWLGCSRVSLGSLHGRCVQVQAMSHTDTFNRGMQVVQAIEAAMEECLDQDLEIVHPAGESAIASSRAAARFS